MAIVLKENTTLNSLVQKIEKEREKINKEKQRIGKKNDEINKKVYLLNTKYKKAGKRAFAEHYRKTYLYLAVLASCCFCLVWTANLNLTVVGTCWSVAMLSTLLIYTAAKTAYTKRFLYKVSGLDIDDVLDQQKSLHREYQDVLIREAKNVQDVYEHGVEFSGNSGEQSVIRYIKDHFEDDTYLINDIRIPCGKKTTQIDHILVSPRGVFCLETKNYGCEYYRFNDETWFFRKGLWGMNKVEVKSPQAQSVYHAKMLYNALNTNKAKIIPLVVLSNPNGVFHGNMKPCTVIHTKHLAKTVKKYNKIYTNAEARSLANKILALHVKRK